MLRRSWIVFMLLWVAVLPAVAVEGAPGRTGRAEVRFLQGMIDHHQMALMMATHCLNQEISADLAALCQQVIDAQTPEIELMSGWLGDWYQIDYQPMDLEDMPGMSGGMGGMRMGGMRSDPPGMMGMMAGFNEAEGIEYEILWLESMIDHHDDAIHMSERILRRAMHPELRELAAKIIADQSAEIKLMETMLMERDAEP